MRSTDPPKPKLHEYTLPGGWTVLVGKTESDNDFLSLKVAGPDDFWFHVRGMPGSHALLKAKEGQEPDRETRRMAAAIAAYHSKARGGGVVPVSCTRARYVTKPRGAKRGTVSIRREILLHVKPGLPRSEGCTQAPPEYP